MDLAVTAYEKFQMAFLRIRWHRLADEFYLAETADDPPMALAVVSIRHTSSNDVSH